VSQKIEEVKQLVEFWQWQCANRLQHLSKKIRFPCFPVLPDSAEAQFI